MFATLALLSLVAGATRATLSFTAPAAGAIWQPNTPYTVSWKDDGHAPTLAQLGTCVVQICTGNATYESCIDTVSNTVPVASTSSLSLTFPSNIGPSGQYTVRFQSTSYKPSGGGNYYAFVPTINIRGISGTLPPASPLNQAAKATKASASHKKATSVHAATTPVVAAAPATTAPLTNTVFAVASLPGTTSSPALPSNAARSLSVPAIAGSLFLGALAAAAPWVCL